MNEKKTVLFLMNGFGQEGVKSFEVFSKETMPTFTKLMNVYPFKLLYSSGEFIGNNKGEASNFRDGYYNFSTFGCPTTKFDIMKKKFASNEVLTNKIVNDSIDIAINNKSRLHVMFTLGDKVNKDRYDQLNSYLELAKSKGIENVYMHLIVGDNSIKDLKIGNKCIRDFRNRVIRFYPFVKIASVCGNKYARDGNQSDIADFYRMMVSGIGEVWTDYEGTIDKKYSQGMTDYTLNGFITLKENLLRAGDSIFLFTYSNSVDEKFLKVLLNPKQYFPTSNVPEGMIVNALFKLTNLPQIPYAFENELPETYFLDKIPDDKKVLIIADNDRLPYISSSLNGTRKEFKSNVSVWPIKDKAKRFSELSQYLAAYINQDAYDLIIADCQLYEQSVDERSIEQIKKNLYQMDKCLNIIYSQCELKNYRLIATSLYGIRYTFKLTDTMELIDMSSKTPFLLIDKEIRRVDLVFKPSGSFIDVAKIVAYSFGCVMKNNLIQFDVPGEKKAKSKLPIMIGGFVVILLILLLLFLYSMGYIG